MRYADKHKREALIQLLLEDRKSFFTKYGAATWDFALRLMGGKPLYRNKMLNKLFLEIVAAPENPSVMSEKFGEVVDKLSDTAFETLKGELSASIASSSSSQIAVKLIDQMDRMVKKELLSSEVVHQLLFRICENDRLASDENFIRSLCDSTFDGVESLMKTKEGVYALCRMCGYWSAPQRRTFMKQMKDMMSLDKTITWATYLTNDVDSIFVCRLLETIDDTKASGENIICSALGFKRRKTGETEIKDKEQLNSVLRHFRGCAMLVRVSPQTPTAALPG